MQAKGKGTIRCLIAGARAEVGSYGVTGDIQRRIDAARAWLEKCRKTVGYERTLRESSAAHYDMLRGIDYSAKANRRICNFRLLDKALRGSNLLKVNLDDASVPLVYPYLVEDGARLRQYLIDHQVFCARYWPNVLEWCQPNDWEYRLAEDLVCLPIDQRYGEEEMRFILDLFGGFK